MGLLSKLREMFSKKSIESFNEIEAEFEKIQKKSSSQIIALIGTSGKLKGLPLVYVSKEEDNLRSYAARITEFANPLKNIFNEKKIKEFIIQYEDSILYFNPIMKDISLIAIIENQSDIAILQQWINNKNEELKEIFHSD